MLHVGVGSVLVVSVVIVIGGVSSVVVGAGTNARPDILVFQTVSGCSVSVFHLYSLDCIFTSLKPWIAVYTSHSLDRGGAL